MDGHIDVPVRERLHQEVVGTGAQHRPCIRVRWAVLATQPQGEHWAEQNLRHRGYQPYLPLFASMQRDRTIKTFKRLALKPLFPGYIFCQHDPRDPWRPIRYCPGIRANLLGGKGIQYASTAAVDALQATDAQRLLPIHRTPWRPGAVCELADGPFHGHTAVVLRLEREMALVSLMMFGQLREVAVDVDCLRARDA